MRRNIDFEKIDDVNTYILKQLILLKSNQKKTLTDIGRISSSYKGKDADLLIAKYTNRVNAISVYINYLEEYCKFLGWLSSGYGEAYTKAKQELDSMMIDESELVEFKTTEIFDMDNILKQ